MPSKEQDARATSRYFDPERVRAEFPILHQEIHGRPLAYLDNAASAQRPRVVVDAIRQCYEQYYANVHRGVHTLSQRATEAYEGARDRVVPFIGASSREEVIFVRGTTDGLNLLAATLGQSLERGDEILLTRLEHHSNIVPWQLVAGRTGATIRVVELDENCDLDLEDLDRKLTDRTKIVALAHVSNALGVVNPVAEIASKARAKGATVVVDGAQGAPHVRLDVQALGCDFYVFSGHKMYGPGGIGVLWGRRELLEALPPYQGGGDMIRTVSFEETTYNTLPYKFEAGTPDIADAIGLGAAVDYLESLGLDAVEEYEDGLVNFACDQLQAIPGVRLVGTPRERVGVVSFDLEGIHPHDVGTILDQEGVAVRAGHHCAQPLMQALGATATTRASFSFYNTSADVERLVAGIERVREVFA